ncbi:MAG: radical SAM protein [bacterium]
MKVLLIQPTQKNVYGVEIKSPYAPLGLLYVGACLARANHEVDFIDIDADGFNEAEIVERMNMKKFDLVGFSSFTATINNVLKMAEFIKKTIEIPIIVGGIHATIAGEELIKDKNIDFVVRGEGEETIIELLEALGGRKILSEVKGIYYKDKNGIIFTGVRPLIENLDDLPFPARYLLKHPAGYISPDALKMPVTSIMTSRGCLGNCTYCCTKQIFGRSIRFRSVRNVADEIKEAIEKYGFNEIHIMDDSFTQNKQRVLEFRDTIKERGIKTTFVFSNGIRADQVDEDILRAFKDLGVLSVGFGVESGNQTILNNIKKGIKLETVRRAFRLSKKYGFETWGFFMIGLPGETRETIRETIDFAKELEPDFAKFLILKPYPGSEVFNQLYQQGRIFDFNYNHYGTYTAPVHDLPGLSKEEILKLQKEALRKFYLRPSTVLKTIRRMRSLTQIKLNLKSGIFLLKSMLK